METLKALLLFFSVPLFIGWYAQAKRGRVGILWFVLAFGVQIIFEVTLVGEVLKANGYRGLDPTERTVAHLMSATFALAVMALAVWSLPRRGQQA